MNLKKFFVIALFFGLAVAPFITSAQDVNALLPDSLTPGSSVSPSSRGSDMSSVASYLRPRVFRVSIDFPSASSRVWNAGSYHTISWASVYFNRLNTRTVSLELCNASGLVCLPWTEDLGSYNNKLISYTLRSARRQIDPLFYQRLEAGERTGLLSLFNNVRKGGPYRARVRVCPTYSVYTSGFLPGTISNRTGCSLSSTFSIGPNLNENPNSRTSATFNNVDVTNFDEATSVWLRGTNRTVTWQTNGKVERVNVLVCMTGDKDGCFYAKQKLTNNGQATDVRLGTNITSSRAYIKVQNVAIPSQFAVSPAFAVSDVSYPPIETPTSTPPVPPTPTSGPALSSYSDWLITGPGRTLTWAKENFNNGTGYVAIWMCKLSANMFGGAVCVNSYTGTDAPNTGSKVIGLPYNDSRLTPGSWQVMVMGIGGNNSRAGLTPAVNLVSSVNPAVPVWGDWSTCSATCGGGTQTQTCLSGDCPVPPTRSQSCNTQACTPNPSTESVQVGDYVSFDIMTVNGLLQRWDEVGYQTLSDPVYGPAYRVTAHLGGGDDDPNHNTQPRKVFRVVAGDSGYFKLQCKNGNIAMSDSQGVINCNKEGNSELNFCKLGTSYGTACNPANNVKLNESFFYMLTGGYDLTNLRFFKAVGFDDPVWCGYNYCRTVPLN